MTFLHVFVKPGLSALTKVGDRVLSLFQIGEPFCILVPQRVVDCSWWQVVVRSLDGTRFGGPVGVADGQNFLIRRFLGKESSVPQALHDQSKHW